MAMATCAPVSPAITYKRPSLVNRSSLHSQTGGNSFAVRTGWKGAGLRIGLQIQGGKIRSKSMQRFSTSACYDYRVKKVSAKELDSILSKERDIPMVVDFYATWCGPCVLLAQELEKLALEYGNSVKFVKVDTDEEHELASQMEIRGLPTMIFVSHDSSKQAIRTEGLLPAQVIRDIIEKEL